MKDKIKFSTAVKTVVSMVLVLVGVLFWTLTATTSKAQFGKTGGYYGPQPSPVFSTETATVNQLVTNKVLFSSVTSPLTNSTIVIDCTGGKEVTLYWYMRYTTATIPATNCTLVLSSGRDPTSTGISNRTAAVMTWVTTGSTTDGGYSLWHTNIQVNARPYLFLDAIVPLAPLTNSSLYYFVK